jgi:hypothetical protein
VIFVREAVVDKSESATGAGTAEVETALASPAVGLGSGSNSTEVDGGVVDVVPSVKPHVNVFRQHFIAPHFVSGAGHGMEP